jgi:hypothetical protein
MVLPGQDLQLQVGNRGGGGHGMAPERSQPLDMGLEAGITGQSVQGFDHIRTTHLLQAPQQVAGIIQHDSRIAACSDQLGQDLSHAPIALGKGFGVVVIALAGMLNHVLQVADQLSSGPGRNRRLMHVQGAGKGRADRLSIVRALPRSPRLLLLHQGQDLGFTAGDWRQGIVSHPAGSRACA